MRKLQRLPPRRTVSSISAVTGLPTTVEKASFCQPSVQLQKSAGVRPVLTKGQTQGLGFPMTRRMPVFSSYSDRSTQAGLDLGQEARKVAAVFLEECLVVLGAFPAQSGQDLVANRAIEVLAHDGHQLGEALVGGVELFLHLLDVGRGRR